METQNCFVSALLSRQYTFVFVILFKKIEGVKALKSSNILELLQDK